jgi:PAS domain S-box-containing protein
MVEPDPLPAKSVSYNRSAGCTRFFVLSLKTRVSFFSIANVLAQRFDSGEIDVTSVYTIWTPFLMVDINAEGIALLYQSFPPRILIIAGHPVGAYIAFQGGHAMATGLDGNEKADRNVCESPDLAASIIASALDAIIVIDDDDRIVLFNPAAERMLACSASEAMGSSVERFIPQLHRVAHSKHIRHFAESGVISLKMGEPGPAWGLRATGEEFPMEASISKVESGGERFFTAVLRDVTDRYRAEQAVRESEQRFRLVADTAPVLIWMSDTEKLCTYFNKPWLNFTGRSLEEELGDGWVDGVHPDDWQRCLDTFRQTFDQRESFEMEYRLRRHDGEYRWILDAGVPRFNQDGSFAGYIGVGVDVTERRRAAENLSRYASIIESSGEAIMGTDLNGIVTHWNKASERLFGYSANEAIGRHISFLGAEHRAAEVRNNLRRVLNGEVLQPYETVRHRKDGTPVDVLLTPSPIVTSSGLIVGTSGICRDISEMKRGQEALARHSAIVESSEDAIISTDLNCVIRSWNPGAERIFGYTPAEVVGQSVNILIPPELQEEEDAIVEKLRAGEPIPHFETIRITKGAKRIDVSWSVSPVRDSTGKVVGGSKIARDITEQKLEGQQRLLSENRFRQFFETLPEYCYMVSPQGEIMDANPAVCAVLGYTKDELVGKPVSVIYAPECQQKAPEIFRRWKTDGFVRNEEMVIITKQGQRRAVLLNIGAIRDAAGEMVSSASVHIDITDRKASENRLREYEKAVEGLEEMLVVVDRQYQYLIANRKFLTMRNLTREQVEGRLAKDVMNTGVFEAVAKERLDECFKGKVVRYEMKYAYPDIGEREILVSYFPIDGPTGVDRVACIFQDITERKQAEAALSDMARKLVEAQEQERARIARELHDDITQRLAMLAIELGQIQANRNDLPPDFLSRMHDLRQQTTQISADVQALSHDLHSSNFEFLGVAAGIKSWCDEFGERKGIGIEFNSCGLLNSLRPEISLCLFRVLQEAANNAARHGGAKRIEVQLTEEPWEVHLLIRDFGLGFDIDAARQGRGLGLTSMQERVRMLGGKIAIDSKLKGGTTIHVRVPLGNDRGKHDSPSSD